MVPGKRKHVSDGPYTGGKDEAAGYVFIDAEDLPYAAEIAKGGPILEVGDSVEVRPIQVLTR